MASGSVIARASTSFAADVDPATSSGRRPTTEKDRKVIGARRLAGSMRGRAWDGGTPARLTALGARRLPSRTRTCSTGCGTCTRRPHRGRYRSTGRASPYEERSSRMRRRPSRTRGRGPRGDRGRGFCEIASGMPAECGELPWPAHRASAVPDGKSARPAFTGFAHREFLPVTPRRNSPCGISGPLEAGAMSSRLGDGARWSPRKRWTRPFATAYSGSALVTKHAGEPG